MGSASPRTIERYGVDSRAPELTAERDHGPGEFQVARVLQLLRDCGEQEKSRSVLLEGSAAPSEMAQSEKSKAQFYSGGVCENAQTLSALETFHSGHIAWTICGGVDRELRV